MSRPGPLTIAVLATLASVGATTAPTTPPPPPSSAKPATMPATMPSMALPPAAPAVPPGPDMVKRLYAAVAPSLVGVQFTFAGDVQQADIVLPGIVIDDRGLVLFPFMPQYFGNLPDEQLKKFKVIVPHLETDNEELEAEFQGRDDRTNMAVVRVKPAKAARTWTPVRFTLKQPDIGQTVYSVGILPRSGGYHAVVNQSMISSHLRGPIKQEMVAGGGLAPYGGPVFDETGTAVGIVGFQFGPLSLDDRNSQQSEAAEELITNRSYLPTAEFAATLADPPSAGHPVAMSYSGLTIMNGLKEDAADYLGLAGRPVVQLGDVLADSPAAKAGLKGRDIIVTYNGQPLERGDTAEELSMILHQKLAQLPPGQTVTFGVMRGGTAGKPVEDVRVTLAPRPAISRDAKRYWSDDIGFGVRDPVVLDRYGRKMKPGEADGVVVTTLKPEGSAQSARLQPEDMIVQVNGTPTPTLGQFKTVYDDFRKAHPHDAIVMVVKRDGREQTIRIEPPQ